MDVLTGWFRILLEVSLSLVPVMALLLLCRPLLKRRYRAKWAYWAWLLVAARLLLPINLSLSVVTPVSIPEPGFSVNLPIAFEQKNKAPVEAPPGQPGADDSAMQGASGDAAAHNPLPIKASVVMDGWTVVAWAWLVGMACALILRLTPYVRFRRRVKRWSTPLADPAFDMLCDELGVKGLGLARCGAVTVPMVSGYWRPTLLLPAEGDLPPEPILRHEILHHKRRDLWYKLLLLVVECVHWFNPLVWLMAAAANRDLERACDEAVTAERDGDYREAYSRAILDAVDSALVERAPLTSYFHGGKRAMLERLSSILSAEGKKRGTAVLALLLTAAILGTAFVAVGRSVVMEDDEFQITLPHGMTWEGPNQKPGLTARFYQDGVEAGGLDTYRSTRLGAADLLGPSESKMLGTSVLDTQGVEVWDGWVQRKDDPDKEIHYLFWVVEDQQFCDLWFRQGMVTEREARTAAESFLHSLGAAHAKSPDGRYDLSYLLTEEGSRWLLREGGEIIDALTTPSFVVWQTARWSPDSQWAAVLTGTRFSTLAPVDGKIVVRDLAWHSDTSTPIGWSADNRMEFSFVRKAEDGLESGTAHYDPAMETVSQIKNDGRSIYRTVQPSGAAGADVPPPWAMPMPVGVTVVWDEESGDANLMRGGEAVGSVQWTTLTVAEMSGRVGLQTYHVKSGNPKIESMEFLFPVGTDGRAYRLILRLDAFRQDLVQAIAKAFLVDGKEAYRFTYDTGVKDVGAG